MDKTVQSIEAFIELVKSSVIEAQASINAIAHASALRARQRATVSSERASSKQGFNVFYLHIEFLLFMVT